VLDSEGNRSDGANKLPPGNEFANGVHIFRGHLLLQVVGRNLPEWFVLQLRDECIGHAFGICPVYFHTIDVEGVLDHLDIVG